MPQFQPQVTVTCPTCGNVESQSVCPLCQQPITRRDVWSQLSAMVSGPVGRLVVNVHDACMAQPGVTLAAVLPDLVPPADDPPAAADV